MSNQIDTLKLGAHGPEVASLALGCMSMSGMYAEPDDAESIATIHRATERGITLIDTGDFYGMGHNEMLIGKAVADRRDRVQLSVKFGAQRGPDGSWIGFDARPAAVKTALAYTLKRLGVDYIDVYRPARLDPAVPIEDTVGAVQDLIRAGYVRHLGLSEVGVDTLRRALAVHPVVDLQIEYSLASRGPEAQIFPALREMGVSATLYGVFSRGLLTGSKPAGKGDFRGHLPRFAEENRVANDAAVTTLQTFAEARGLSVAALCVAWVRAKQPGFLPLLGCRTRAQLDDAFGALDVRLGVEDLAELERVMPVVQGGRYDAGQMAHLDSER